MAAGPSDLTRRTNMRPWASSALSPNQGFDGSRERPVAIRSARIGLRRSMGTNMLQGTEPTPETNNWVKIDPIPRS